MQLNQSTIQPKKGHQKDRYQGKIDPKTKLRHGQGTYHYPNTYFTYQGQYLNGVKNGKGTFNLGDGTKINGNFVNGQLMGQAQILYPDGSSYKGNLQYGQRHGNGIFDSIFQHYQGQWIQNRKQGKGILKNKTTSLIVLGQFLKNKPHGKCSVSKWGYSYQGDMENGLKCGQGIQKDLSYDQGYQYQGSFKNDKFQGQGLFQVDARSGQKYCYKGQFTNGKPNQNTFPNQFRIQTSINKKQQQSQKQSQKTIISEANSVIQYQLQTESFNIYVDSVYQGPQELDPVQPTQQQIDQMIKNWQNQNKKNKNPPPMPDFNQPRMKKPNLVLIQQQSKRNITFNLLKIDGEKEDKLKIDYRQLIALKRKENQQLKAQALKKAQQDGGKKGGKKDAKGGQAQLKVNAYVENPLQKDKILNIRNKNGIAVLKNFQLPDDFPPGKYYINIKSSFKKFGQIPQRKIELNVKAKQVGKKK